MTLRVGAHASIAGGVHNAVDEQREFGGNCGQIFSHSPQVWQEPNIEADNATRFREGSAEHDIGPWVIHAPTSSTLRPPRRTSARSPSGVSSRNSTPPRGWTSST